MTVEKYVAKRKRTAFEIQIFENFNFNLRGMTSNTTPAA